MNEILAVIVALPKLTPLTVAVLLSEPAVTVATPEELVLQVTLAIPFPETVRVPVCDLLRTSDCGSIFAYSESADTTVTAQVLVMLPSSVVTVMVAEPTLRPVMVSVLPFLTTEII